MQPRLVCLVLLTLSFSLPAADILPPANERFRADTTETPSFQRHVVPLMGRLGCNGRACHGSFQGQGSLRLSLFGYDFASDHAAFADPKLERINLKDPAASLMLRKPTLQEKHKGGKRMEADGWEYQLLLRWLKAGAPARPETAPAFETLIIEPREIVFAKPGEKTKLRVVAAWADGTREDVTPLCRFRSNDESVATVDEAGTITAAGKGDTAIVAFYDNGIVPVPVLLPVSDKLASRYPAVPTPTRIDELVVAKLRKMGVVPSEVCTDAEFLRRVNLDLTGTLPTPAEVQAFLANPGRDKRAKKIDELLSRPAYAAWWASKLGDFTGNNEKNGPLGGEQYLNRDKARQWYDWLYRRVNENRPYDEIVEGIMLAVGHGPDQSYEDYCKEMSSYFRASNPGDFSARETMPYFWSRKALGKPEERALAVAHAFLGVNLQCAQCHKHPYDQWTKQDFDQFTAFFNGLRANFGDRKISAEMKKGTGLETLDQDTGNYKRRFQELLASGKVLPFNDLTLPRPPIAKKGVKPTTKVGGRVITPKLLGGSEVVDQQFADVRQPVMDWMREGSNPYFSRAFVNRVWASYFNVGIIEPADDLNLANPPSNPALLEFLAEGFEASGYDMKWLHRTIANSRTYQLSWKPNETNKHDERNFSRSVIRRMPAEVAYDALVMATASDAERTKFDADPSSLRAIGRASGYTGSKARGEDFYALQLFGRNPRSINCDCERSNEPALLQIVFLRNDPEVLKLLDRPDGWLKAIGKGTDNVDALVKQAYLRTLSRLPDDRELAAARKGVGSDVSAGMRDLVWVLLNTKEFLVNR